MQLAQDATTAFQDSTLQVYLLGTVDFDAILRLQRRLQFEASGDRIQAALILCEHPPLISVGRHGSQNHIHLEPNELAVRGWPVRWVRRGGGCWLHLPGQFAVYAVLPLGRLRIPVPAHLRCLASVVQRSLANFDVGCEAAAGGVQVNGRPIANLGVAVQEWVSAFGLCLNVYPSLDAFRHVRCSPGSQATMTSLERERRGRVKPALVRERIIEHFQTVFGFAGVSLFSSHPALQGAVARSATSRSNVCA